MKKIATLLFILILLPAVFLAGNLKAYLSYSIFNTPEHEPYIETYLVVKGSSLTHLIQEDGTYQGSLDIQIIFRIGDSIVNFGKYELFGPKISDTIQITDNLLDVQRYALPEGNYILELTLSDKNSSEEAITTYDEFSVSFPTGQISISDIEFLHSFKKSDSEQPVVKNGYELIPLVFNYIPEAVRQLNFYAEIYNSDKLFGSDAYVVYYYVKPFEVDKKLDRFFRMQRMAASKVNVLLSTLDISELPSGNYLFVIEARDKNNELLVQKELYFQRHNPSAQFSLVNMLSVDAANSFAGAISSRDTLIQFIDYLYPISTESEKDLAKSIVKESSVDELQGYFLSFWLERDQNNPEVAWIEYKTRVDQVNHDFRSVKIPGYKTDRGRVYLQYGKPNVIVENYLEPGAYPYEIWHYYEINGQRDKRFVFYSRDMVTVDFQLIHSDAIGELYNYRWQAQLYERTWDAYNIDDEYAPASYGEFATDYYLQPR